MMSEPILQKPGAGLPLVERLLGRYFYMPYYSRKNSWDDSLKHFEKEGQRILKLITPLSIEELQSKVLIDRITGMEDSSRYWSAAMTVEHLIIVGKSASEVMVLLSQGKVPPIEVRIENVKPKGKLKPESLHQEYSSFLKHYQQKLNEQIVDRTSRTVLYHPWMGPMNVAQWNWLMASHQTIHRKQIQGILKGLVKKESY